MVAEGQHTTQSTRFDLRDCSDVISGREHKLVVANPFWFVIEDMGRVKGNNLVIFDGEVVSSTFKVCNLHVVSIHDGLADVQIVIL